MTAPEPRAELIEAAANALAQRRGAADGEAFTEDARGAVSAVLPLLTVADLPASLLDEHEQQIRAKVAEEMKPGRWWTVLTPAGSVWCQTSDESEARASVRPGDTLYRQYVGEPARELRKVTP